MERTPVRGTVAEEAHGHLAGLTQLRRPPGASGDAKPSGHNAVGAQHADRKICNVHGATLALAIAGGAAKQLGHHAFDISALGNTMAVAAMRAGDVIAALQRFAHAHGDGFLADVEVRQAGHLGRLVKLVHLLFEGTNLSHLLVQVQPVFAIQFRCGHISPRSCRPCAPAP